MLAHYRQIWATDFEYHQDRNRRPEPVCLTALELRSGQRVQLWRTEFGAWPPYPTGRDVLHVTYHASAETGCHLKLGWPLAENLIDLEAEFRCATTGHRVECGKGLVGAMTAHGLAAIAPAEKRSMQDRIAQGPPFTKRERAAILAYCWGDTDGTAALFSRMLTGILERKHGLEHALIRGEYSGHAVGWMEHRGTPLDVANLGRLRTHWDAIRTHLVAQYDPMYGVYDGLTFKLDRFVDYLVRNDIAWPVLHSGQPELKDDTFREMGELYPQVEPLRQLRHTLSQLRLHDIAVGDDGRNRCMLGQFVASSGRNAPKASQFIFGPSVWLRSLIMPPPGHGLAYLDWSQQEFLIAAVLSGDSAMIAATASDDAYLSFAKMAGLVPADARREDHEQLREICKRCCLGILYGMGTRALAFRTNTSELAAAALMEHHRRIFPIFWAWSRRAVREAGLFGHIDMSFGWRIHDGPDTSQRSLMNAPMQSNAAEMMRLAACLGTRAGVQITAPVHDAFLITAPLTELEDAIATMRGAMLRASAAVLAGPTVSVGVNKVRWPDRYSDPRGVGMWQTVTGYLDAVERAA